MKLKIIQVGKTKTLHWRSAEKEYLQRIARFTEVQQVVVRDASLQALKNPAQIKRIEAKDILSKLNNQDFFVALDRTGQQMPSTAFAAFLQEKQQSSAKMLTFVIGGSEGLEASLLNQANLTLFFSEMTFPHEMFKVMLLEQIYRAFTILHHENYHK
ncbi:MAG: 23S rRNA (pseudouridine(1915)-N(3))-methyltransferase RlmH [bacterium]